MIPNMVALAVLLQSGIPNAPYQLESVRVISENSFPSTVSGNTLYYCVNNVTSSFDLANFRNGWSTGLKTFKSANSILVSGDRVFVSGSSAKDQKASQIMAFNRSSGRPLWTIAKQGEGGAMACDDQRLYASLGPAGVSAVDLATRKTVWTTPMKPKFGSIVRARVADRTLVISDQSTAVGMDRKTGKVLWQVAEQWYYSSSIPYFGGAFLLLENNQLVGRDAKTGKVRWSVPNVDSDRFEQLDDAIVTVENDRIVARNPLNGKPKWTKSVPPRSSVNVLNNRFFVSTSNQTTILDSKGQVVWSLPNDQPWVYPTWANGDALVSISNGRFVRFISRPPIRIPSDATKRMALAESLFGKDEKRDEYEEGVLFSMHNEAFQIITKAFLEACDKADTHGEYSYELSKPIQRFSGMLWDFVQPGDTQKLIDLLKGSNPKKSCWGEIISLLTMRGDNRVTIPYFLDQIAAFPDLEPRKVLEDRSLWKLFASSDPRAVDFTISVLKNPKAESSLRFTAYTSLASTGNPKGLEAVRSERRSVALLKPIEERMQLNSISTNEKDEKWSLLLGTKKDANGQTWGLILNSILGRGDDIWIAKKIGDRWTDPKFTGVTVNPDEDKNGRPLPPVKINGKTPKELTADGWFEAFVVNPEIAKDSDSDGLNDLAEKRLGTNPLKRDSDGDGVDDNIDPFPNTPKGPPLTDDQKVFAAVFEAQSHLSESPLPALFFGVSGVKPFEMPGRTGPVMWIPAEGSHPWSAPLEACFDFGPAFIRPEAIRWNQNRTEAKVFVTYGYRRLDATTYGATVRKIGNEWFVIKMGISGMA